jgi:hypothetical protein
VRGRSQNLVKQGITSAWASEHSDVEQVAVAGDPANGPLIGVVTDSGAALGSLSAGWTTEVSSNVRAIAVASDATHGPLIAVLLWSGEPMVKEGSLSAPWNDEYSSAVEVSVASDPANGPLIGIVTEGTVTNPYDNEAYVKEGSLTAGWNNEYSGVEQLTVASDSVNGPLIGVQDIEDGPDGRLLVKTGALDAGWNVENTDVARARSTSLDNHRVVAARMERGFGAVAGAAPSRHERRPPVGPSRTNRGT